MSTLTRGNRDSSVYDNTVSVLTVIFLKLSSDYRNGKIKSDDEFERAFLKYYSTLAEGDSDFMELPADWAYGIGNNCTGREDVAASLGLTSVARPSRSAGNSMTNYVDATEERICELLTTLDTDDRVVRFNSLAKNSKRINTVANKVLSEFSTKHKYVTYGEYVAPVRDDKFMTEERKKIYQKIEDTFGEFHCCASRSSLNVGDMKPSKWTTKGSGQNRVAYMGNNVSISVMGYESHMRSSFVDFICTLGSDESKLSSFDGEENELISYFEGEEMAELLRVNYDALENISASDYMKFDKLLKPIADHYGYKLKDRYGKKGDELRREFVTDMWNLYSLAVGKMSKFKGVEDYMVCISKVSPYDASSATLAKCYYNLCKEYRNDTIERVEYYDSVAVGQV